MSPIQAGAGGLHRRLAFIACAVIALPLAACIPAAAEKETAAAGAPAPDAQAARTDEIAEAQPAPPISEPISEPAPPPEPIGPADFVIAGELTQGGWIKGQAPGGTRAAFLGEEALELDSEGRFFAAFDRDAGTEAVLRAVLESGATQTKSLAISPRRWNIERVNVARRSGGASASFMARRKPELDAIWDARERETGASGYKQDFIWPVKGRISGRFGSQRIYRGEPGSYHTGIDIAPGYGVPFVAPADGVVVLAVTNFSLEGQLLIIDHGAGLNSAFLHASKLAVSEGETVRQGQHIGNIGSSGRATGPHLHWGLKWHNARLDPLLFTGPM
jgi:murein DD-endopeptidase MepM/ murein hydrolase activator NlpD